VDGAERRKRPQWFSLLLQYSSHIVVAIPTISVLWGHFYFMSLLHTVMPTFPRVLTHFWWKFDSVCCMGNTWTLAFLFEAAFFQRRLALFYIPFLIATICSFLVAYAFCNFFSRRLEIEVCLCLCVCVCVCGGGCFALPFWKRN